MERMSPPNKLVVWYLGLGAVLMFAAAIFFAFQQEWRTVAANAVGCILVAVWFAFRVIPAR
jgi:hypothetical protein